MEDVSDPPFRYVCKLFGADVVYSEFISADGLIRDSVKSIKKLDFEEMERPVGIQIFGNAVEPMVEAARYAETAHPDIIDINFGCPVKKVASKGAGSGIMNDIPKMVAITKAVVEAVNTPVTVKTRLGYDDAPRNRRHRRTPARRGHRRLDYTRPPAHHQIQRARRLDFNRLGEKQPPHAHPYHRQRRRGGWPLCQILQGHLWGGWPDDRSRHLWQSMDFQSDQTLSGDRGRAALPDACGNACA